MSAAPTDFDDAVCDGVASATAPRTEFGEQRSSCACGNCQLNCRFMPGFLIPADLARMVPPGSDPFEWAERNLLASPGALVSSDGKRFRIPTLVPAVKQDGSCVNLTSDGRCAIHGVSPFGCAFFSCGPEVGGLSAKVLSSIMLDCLNPDGLYKRIWLSLYDKGRTQVSADELRARMARHIEEEPA